MHIGISCMMTGPMHYNYIGFNVETITYKNVYFTTWDVGGGAKIVSDIGTNISY